MCINMPKNIQEERLRWVKVVEESNTRLKDVILIFKYKTFYIIWISQ